MVLVPGTPNEVGPMANWVALRHLNGGAASPISKGNKINYKDASTSDCCWQYKCRRYRKNTYCNLASAGIAVSWI